VAVSSIQNLVAFMFIIKNRLPRMSDAFQGFKNVVSGPSTFVDIQSKE
jgi:hypothetical protein